MRYANESRRYHGIGLSGPNARELLSRITRDDMSADALKFRDIKRTFVGTLPAILTRLSFSGELGYEIYVEPEYQLKLSEEILANGEGLGLTHYGLRALMSLRLEKQPRSARPGRRCWFGKFDNLSGFLIQVNDCRFFPLHNLAWIE